MRSPKSPTDPKVSILQGGLEVLSLIAGVVLGAALGVYIASDWVDSLPHQSGLADLYRMYWLQLAVIVMGPVGAMGGGSVVWLFGRWLARRKGNAATPK